MFSKKKEERPKREGRDRNLAQYGLFDVPSNLSFDDPNMNDDDDDDLEAELMALTSNQGAKPRPKSRVKDIPSVNLDSLIADSLKDIPSDEDLSGDDDDPDLLDELKEITQDVEVVEEAPPPRKEEETDLVKVLELRLQMYVLAEQNAKKSGEISRARRFTRGIKTLKDLIKQANAGKAINPDDILPEVSTGENKKPVSPQQEINNVPIRTAPEIPVLPILPTPEQEKHQMEPKKQENEEKIDEKKLGILNMLKNRRDEYKIAAVKAKKLGDTQMAIRFMKIGKQFDIVIKAVEQNQDVDLSNMPGPPDFSLPCTSKVEEGKKEDSEIQNQENDTQSEEIVPVEENLINPANLLDGLEQRMQIYVGQVETAKHEGNSSKSRRMGRIVKQYEQAIKNHKTGKPVPLDELPNPPGFAPLIPKPEKPDIDTKPTQDERMDTTTDMNTDLDSTTPKTTAKGGNEIPQRPSRPLGPLGPLETHSEAPETLPRGNSVRKMGNQTSTTHNQRQVMALLHRQQEFKQAALESKKKGELAQAKEYLRTAKGFDRVVEAARCGLPVDMESLPLAPNARSRLDESYELVIADECTEDESGTLDMLTRLEDQLSKQLKMCLTTRDHHKAIGDVAGMNRFEHLALSVTKDLDIIRLAHRTNSNTIPKFHYENKSFSVVKCCTDLNDNDFELAIIRGINYNCANPKEIDTYVKFEFPYPQEEPVKDRTSTIKDTNNPEYNSIFSLPILRTARPCLRVFKRQAVKFEVYSRGGFFRGDSLLGSVTVKLQPLETQCEIHDSYELMDGRKKIGGKLEIRMRIRNPMVTKQMEQINEKWLIIDH